MPVGDAKKFTNAFKDFDETEFTKGGQAFLNAVATSVQGISDGFKKAATGLQANANRVSEATTALKKLTKKGAAFGAVAKDVEKNAREVLVATRV